jgi:hypothetical protein
VGTVARELTSPPRVTISESARSRGSRVHGDIVTREGTSEAWGFVTISRESSHVKHGGFVTICWGIVTRGFVRTHVRGLGIERCTTHVGCTARVTIIVPQIVTRDRDYGKKFQGVMGHGRNV